MMDFLETLLVLSFVFAAVPLILHIFMFSLPAEEKHKKAIAKFAFSACAVHVFVVMIYLLTTWVML